MTTRRAKILGASAAALALLVAVGLWWFLRFDFFAWDARPPGTLVAEKVAPDGALGDGRRSRHRDHRSRLRRRQLRVLPCSLASARPKPPNKRLKLSAPGNYGRIPFMTNETRRRSLSAIR